MIIDYNSTYDMNEILKEKIPKMGLDSLNQFQKNTIVEEYRNGNIDAKNITKAHQKYKKYNSLLNIYEKINKQNITEDYAAIDCRKNDILLFEHYKN